MGEPVLSRPAGRLCCSPPALEPNAEKVSDTDSARRVLLVGNGGGALELVCVWEPTRVRAGSVGCDSAMREKEANRNCWGLLGATEKNGH